MNDEWMRRFSLRLASLFFHRFLAMHNKKRRELNMRISPISQTQTSPNFKGEFVIRNRNGRVMDAVVLTAKSFLKNEGITPVVSRPIQGWRVNTERGYRQILSFDKIHNKVAEKKVLTRLCEAIEGAGLDQVSVKFNK